MQLQAREKQLVRLGRESALAAQRVRLANGKRITLRDLQVGLGFRALGPRVYVRALLEPRQQPCACHCSGVPVTLPPGMCGQLKVSGCKDCIVSERLLLTACAICFVCFDLNCFEQREDGWCRGGGDLKEHSCGLPISVLLCWQHTILSDLQSPHLCNAISHCKRQGSSRCVLLAGTPSQVAASLEAAEQYKEALQQRGVFIIPLTIFDEAASTSSTDGSNGEGSGAVQQPALPPLTKEDLRWRGEPEGLQGYKQWFADQLSLTSSKVNSATGRQEAGCRWLAERLRFTPGCGARILGRKLLAASNTCRDVSSQLVLAAGGGRCYGME